MVLSDSQNELVHRLESFVEKLIVKHGIDPDMYISRLLDEVIGPHCHSDKLKYRFGAPEENALGFATRCHPDQAAILEEFADGVAALRREMPTAAREMDRETGCVVQRVPSAIPDPSPELIIALNACEKRVGVYGMSFQPKNGALKYESFIRKELGEMGINPRGTFYTLTPCVVKHFKENHGLDTNRAINLSETKSR